MHNIFRILSSQRRCVGVQPSQLICQKICHRRSRRRPEFFFYSPADRMLNKFPKKNLKISRRNTKHRKDLAKIKGESGGSLGRGPANDPHGNTFHKCLMCHVRMPDNILAQCQPDIFWRIRTGWAHFGLFAYNKSPHPGPHGP